MDIDFTTGKVSYPERDSERDELLKTLEEMKIQDTPKVEPTFSKTVHQNLKYGRWKYMIYCLLLMVDGLIGVVSIGQTQSILAQKYLLSDYIMGDYDANR
jgi:hypothetical protein